MTFNDEVILIKFITRPGMFITVQDKDNFTSFLFGYEVGSATCNFTEPLESYISETFGIQPSSSRWIGQVEELSKKLSLSWVTTFRKTSLQFIIEKDVANLLPELNNVLRTRIFSLTNRINETGDPWFNESWVDDWLALCLIDCDWFSQLWTSEELKLIKAIDTKVKKREVFSDKESFLPSSDLLKLKGDLDKLKVQKR